MDRQAAHHPYVWYSHYGEGDRLRVVRHGQHRVPAGATLCHHLQQRLPSPNNTRSALLRVDGLWRHLA